MTKQLLFSVTLLVTILNYSFGQSDKYNSLIKQSDEAYDAKDFKKCGELCAEAFKLNEKTPLWHRYNAACCWALANEPDPAFELLFEYVEKSKDSQLDGLSVDKDFEPLYKDERWSKLMGIVRVRLAEVEKNYNWDLVNELNQIHKDDQSGRMEARAICKQDGRDSKECKEIWKKINKQDSINLGKVSRIIDKHGWLGPDIISKKGSSALFLVIQHSDLETQLKYLPIMKEAVNKGDARASSLALLVDRTNLEQGKRQTYGSQIGSHPDSKEPYVLPLEDPDNVDKRRAEVGLMPLASYTQFFELEWNLEEYKKQLPIIEAKLAAQKAEKEKMEAAKQAEITTKVKGKKKKKRKKKRRTKK